MKNFMPMLSFCLISLFVLLAIASGDENVSDAVKRRDSEDSPHDYTFDINGGKADIEAGNLNIRITLETGDGPKIFMSYKGNSANRFMFKMFIKRIVEYVPDNTTGYQRGMDKVVKIYGSAESSSNSNGKGAASVSSGAWAFGDFVDNNPNSTTDRRFYALTTDGVVNISFRVNVPAGAAVGRSKVVLGLNDIKFDYSINMDKLKALGFLQTNGTELAIVGILQSRFRHRMCGASANSNNTDNGQSEDGSACANQVDGSAVGYIRWLNVLNCNNTDLKIVTTTIVEDNTDGDSEMENDSSHASVFSWSIENPGRANGTCIWDPIMYGNPSSTSDANSSALGMFFGASLIATIVSFLF